jgi:putative transposase
MRYSAAEQLEIIRLVEQSPLPVRLTLAQLGISRATFARGAVALTDGQPAPRRVWHKLPEAVAAAVIDVALRQAALASRELATAFVDQQHYFVSEASVYRLLKARGLITRPAFILLQAADHLAQPTTAVNQLWQTDFTYLRVIGWGWFYLSTVLDDFSRYLLAWKLCTPMTAADVTETLRLALNAAGLHQATVRQRPRLLSDNGPSYLSAQLAVWLDEHGMRHTRGQPYHPMTQGRIERYHRSLKNRILLENYYLPGELEARLAEFVDFYNNRRYHQSLGNRTPADIYFGRGLHMLARRQKIKHQTIELRRRLHQPVVA